MSNVASCENCGADLHFTPGSKGLTCGYCQHYTAFKFESTSQKANTELDLTRYINGTTTIEDEYESHTLDCMTCGAKTELGEETHSTLCPFCGTPYVTTSTQSSRQIKTQGVLPFKLQRKEARDNFQAWIRGLWFAPTKLKKQITQHDQFQGVYLPYWTYDCDTYTDYNGRRGDYYYENVTRTNSEGKKETKRERRTRWTNVSGKVTTSFDDILIPATQSVPQKTLDKLEPWDLTQIVDYNKQYLVGFVAENYQIDVLSGYKLAQKKMDAPIEKAVKRKIGGDKQSISSKNITYKGQTFKHILLPAWMSSYQFQGKAYQIVVNAQTGEVQGDRPYCKIKIGVALFCFAIFIILLFIINPELAGYVLEESVSAAQQYVE
ncbi:hypothetical protein [Thaumasiovibrio subtropicus]|uniref:hypothetical protein n=1 Tax=Thaumasiovibrio subtropicus TaxID=1891207 RepID=UPI000B35B2F9|nr:hypothetical protein [Thaumasiovibrio subtropicus]